jgi:hypothetical protein
MDGGNMSAYEPLLILLVSFGISGCVAAISGFIFDLIVGNSYMFKYEIFMFLIAVTSLVFALYLVK